MIQLNRYELLIHERKLMSKFLHPNLTVKQTYSNWAALCFKNTDYSITLTFHPKIKQDQCLRSKDISHLIKLVHCKLFKQGVIDNKYQLQCFPVFEKNAVGDYHAHIMLENPFADSKLATEFIGQLIEFWISMKCSGLRAGIKIKQVYDVRNGTSYLTKERLANVELEVDINNLYLNECVKPTILLT